VDALALLDALAGVGVAAQVDAEPPDVPAVLVGAFTADARRELAASASSAGVGQLPVPGARAHTARALACLAQSLARYQRRDQDLVGQPVHQPCLLPDLDQRLPAGLPATWPGPALARPVDAIEHAASGLVEHPCSLRRARLG